MSDETAVPAFSRARADRLLSITSALADAVQPDQVYAAIVDQLYEALEGATVGLWLVDGGDLRLVRDQGLADRTRQQLAVLSMVAPASVPIADAVQRREPIWLDTKAQLVERYPAVGGLSTAVARRVACLPLLAAGEALGGLAVSTDETRPIAEDERRFLMLVARYASQAIHRVRLLALAHHSQSESLAATRRASLLARASRAFSEADLDFSRRLETIVVELGALLDDAVSISLLDETDRLVNVAVFHPDPAARTAATELARAHPLALGEGASGIVARSGEAFFHARLTREDVTARVPAAYHAFFERYPICAALIVPLRDRERIIGTLNVSCIHPAHVHSPDELSTLEQLADRAAPAIETSRLYGELVNSSKRARLMAEASHIVARLQDDEPAMFQALVELFAHVFDGTCAISIVNEDAVLHPAAIYHEDPLMRQALVEAFHQTGSTPLSSSVLGTGKPLFLPVVDRTAFRERVAPPQRKFVDQLRSLAMVPIASGGEPLGVLGVSTYGDEGPRLTVADLDSLVEVASRISIGVRSARRSRENAMLVAKLQEADHAKDEFLAILGHELRNPLAPLVAALDLSDRRGTPPDVTTLQRMRRQVEHLQRLVDDLLDVSKATRGKLPLARRPIDVVETLERAIEMVNPMIREKRHRLLYQAPPCGMIVDADGARLAQIFANLLTNAAKYTDPGGTIEVAVEARAAQIAISVRDNGIGIEPDLLLRVFDMFVQAPQPAERHRGGLGLGLALVKNLVEAHGGAVEAASAGAQCGSTFTVTLPEVTTEHISPAPAVEPVSIAHRRVLLVDDNEDAVEMLAELLRYAGHTVEIAHDAARALVLVETFAPEVAVLDVGLPGMDGVELGRHLRARFPSVRLYALTGYGDARDRTRTREAGFHGHFVKPVSTAALLAALADDAGGA